MAVRPCHRERGGGGDEVDRSRWREVVVRVQDEQGETPISVFAFVSKSLVVLGS